LDEGFGLGFFDDDDLCLRARRAGFRLAVALDCYVHHFGSRTFRGLGVDTGQQLTDNLALYRAKWGAEEAARYGMPAPTAGPRALPAVPAGRPRVSLTMIVRNEEHNLPDCLASVRDLVDEAVVIDTGSTDRTKEIARSFHCVVREFPWIDHFAAARNAAMEPATGDYAFWMDADDRLDSDNRIKLRALFDSLPSGNAAFVMKCLCVGEGSGGAGTAVDHVRLFRLHPAHRWTYRVHEQILPALRATGTEVQWSDVFVRHVGYIDPAVRRRKLDRDLGLLKLDEAERPNDPFTLFNLGSVYHELGDARAASEALEKSLVGSHPKDSIVRKTYALLARCRDQAGDKRAAEAVCRRGRTHYPDDPELLFLAAGYAREVGDHGAAEGLYRKLIDGTEAPHFASVDTGLRAVKGRHNLAVMLLDRGRLSEAEGLWRAALSYDPQFLPAQVGLGEVYVKADNSAGLDRQVAALEGLGEPGAAEAAVLSARWKSGRGDHAGAAKVLESAVKRLPGSLGVRVALSHARISADAPPELLEAAFKGVLELDPHNDQAQRNLAVLYHRTGRTIEGVIDTPTT
jgi:tetratricopeptide (TPR) repeat protein